MAWPTKTRHGKTAYGNELFEQSPGSQPCESEECLQFGLHKALCEIQGHQLEANPAHLMHSTTYQQPRPSTKFC